MLDEADELLELRRRLSLARLLLQIHAPPGRARAEACAAIAEVLPMLVDDEPLPAIDGPGRLSVSFD